MFAAVASGCLAGSIDEWARYSEATRPLRVIVRRRTYPARLWSDRVRHVVLNRPIVHKVKVVGGLHFTDDDRIVVHDTALVGINPSLDWLTEEVERILDERRRGLQRHVQDPLYASIVIDKQASVNVHKVRLS